MRLTPKKWEEFQHYKDRAPNWIKLHRGLIDNLEYHLLSDFSAKRLPLIWLIASENDGVLPDVGKIAFRLRIPTADCERVLKELTDRDFLVEYTGSEPAEQGATLAQRAAKSNGFGTRHISDVTKREVWQRDGGKCRACGSTERLEYDHKKPVSKGGTSEPSNIQILCRPCNRSKRTGDATPAQPLRSLEKRREEIQDKTESRPVAKATRPNSKFEEFWKEYPKRKGDNPKAPARKLFDALVRQGVDPDAIISGVRRAKAKNADKIGTEFIPQAIKWLRDRRWEDYQDDPEPTAGPLIPDDAAFEFFLKYHRWHRDYGPEPGKPGCRASPEVLARHGYGNEEAA